MMGGHRTGQYRVRLQRFHRLFGAHGSEAFTVIEVLIVLAVTALLFVAAAVQISGRQDRTAFQVAVRDVQSQIQKTINEVSVGQFPSFDNVSCTTSPTGPVMTPTPGNAQGINAGCIFMGKVIQFRVGTTDPEQIRIYTIAGLRADPTTGAEVSSPVDAWPKVVAPSTSSPGVPDNSEPDTLQSGLSVYSMVWGSGSGTSIGAVAFSQSLAQYSGGSLVSGSSHLDVSAVNGTSLGMTPEAAAEAINANWASGFAANVNPSEGIRICFASGTTNESGLITIGSKNREVTVTLDVKSNHTCS